MEQLVYKNKLYICGKIPEVILELKTLALEFKTVREYIIYKTKNLQN